VIDMFKDRRHAGQLLARKVLAILSTLKANSGISQIVVGLPRGGVPVAKEVAFILHAPLTVLAAKKIGAPRQQEFAIGAVSSAGTVVINTDVLPFIPHGYSYVRQRARELTYQTRALENDWLKAAGLSTTHDFAKKRAIVVDDGVATGMTTEAALRSLKSLGAAQVILAAPVIAKAAKEKLRRECDLVISLLDPVDFLGIGDFYEDFSQTEDSEVVQALKDVAISQNQSVEPWAS
jgi:putative phosphoribosyl transferase